MSEVTRELFFDKDQLLYARFVTEPTQQVLNSCRMLGGEYGRMGKLLGHTAAQLCKTIDDYHYTTALAIKLHEGGYAGLYAAYLGQGELKHTTFSEIMDYFGVVQNLIPPEIDPRDRLEYCDMFANETLAALPELAPAYEIMTDKLADSYPTHDRRAQFAGFGMVLVASRLASVTEMLTTPKTSDIDYEANELYFSERRS